MKTRKTKEPTKLLTKLKNFELQLKKQENEPTDNKCRNKR